MEKPEVYLDNAATTKVTEDVFETTGITATCGVGTNLYLAKVAMDIVAKHAKANKFGVRIGDTLTVEMDDVKKDW